MILPGQAARDEIVVHQIADTWRVTQYNQPDESFAKVDDAVTYAMAMFRRGRANRAKIIVHPPDSPFMWD